MTALLLLDCMSFVYVGLTSIPLPPTLLVSVIPFISALTIASVRPSVCLFSDRAREPPGMRGSACVEVMTTLHGSAPSLRRRAEGCVSPEGTIASARDPLKSIHIHLEPPSPRRSLFVVPVLVQCPGLSGRLIRGIDQFELDDGYLAE
ncbi:hypothetical protein CK203_114024 [Vitis vinifera]|uniref:Uncharacterized protein n=1 Tax=Vitis vinifera TaxID=29760 RepID=A0A438FF42_VITVI|nr:hypothetical protein CK203_114024 [Vitis vinifera]